MNRRVFPIFGLLLVHGCAHAWQGSDDFSSSSINTNLWKTSHGLPVINVSQNYRQTNGYATFFSTNSSGEQNGMIFWRQPLPSNQSWQIRVKARFDPASFRVSEGGSVEALVGVLPNVNSPRSKFVMCLAVDATNFYSVPNWGINSTQTGATDDELRVNHGLSDVWLFLDYDAGQKTITGSYANAGDPTRIFPAKTLSTSNWQGLTQFLVVFGGYSQDASIGSGVLRMDDFSVAATAPPPYEDMVPVLDPFNPGDPENAGAGGVPYNFAISRTEVTVRQYCRFLNSVAKRNNGISQLLYSNTFGQFSNEKFVECDGLGTASSNYVYTPVAGKDYLPIQVPWFDVARYCNWLHHGSLPTANLEDGAYPLLGTTFGWADVVRRSWSRFYVPSADEWYKAGYYDPTKNGGAGGYWRQPYRSDDGAVDTNRANFYTGIGFRPVGSYANSGSYYGTVDQLGNAWEWISDRYTYGMQGLMGGNYSTESSGDSYRPGDGRFGYFFSELPIHRAAFRVATRLPVQGTNRCPGARGRAFSFRVTPGPEFSDAAFLTYSATNLPAGLSISASSGVISGTPTVSGVFSNTLVRIAMSGGEAGYAVTVPLVFDIQASSSPGLALQAGQLALANRNLPEAVREFGNAAKDAPTNATARMYRALSTLAMLQQNSAGNAILDKFYVLPSASPWDALGDVNSRQYRVDPKAYRTNTYVTTNWDGSRTTNRYVYYEPKNRGVSTTEIINLLRNVHLPVELAAEADLALITDPQFVAAIPRGLVGSTAVTLDYGDIQMLRALLAAKRALAYFVNIHNWGMTINDWQTIVNKNGRDERVTVENVLSTLPSLLRLNRAADGPSCRAELKKAADHYFQASDFIRAQRPEGVIRLFNLEDVDYDQEALFREQITQEWRPALDGARRIQVSGVSSGSLTNGLVAYYPFNGNANDESGNGNHGTVEGASLGQDRRSINQGAYYFGGNNKITIPHAASLGPNQCTVSLWVKANTWVSSDNLVDLIGKDVEARQWVLQIHGQGGDFADGAVRPAVFTESGLGYGDSGVVLPRSTWLHLVQVWDRTNIRAFFNGDKIVEASASGNLASGFGPVRIGGNAGSSLNGWIDDVRIYNRALSAGEISQLYALESGPAGSGSGVSGSILVNGDAFFRSSGLDLRSKMPQFVTNRVRQGTFSDGTVGGLFPELTVAQMEGWLWDETPKENGWFWDEFFGWQSYPTGLSVGPYAFGLLRFGPVIASNGLVAQCGVEVSNLRIAVSNAVPRMRLVSSNLPAWATLDPWTGQITGTPGLEDVTTNRPFSVQLQAASLGGGTNLFTTNRILSLRVLPPRPAFTSTNTLVWTQGVAGRTFANTVEPGSLPGYPVVFAGYQLPPGLTVNRTSGIVNGTPTAPGSFRCYVTATNLGGGTAQEIDWTIQPAGGFWIDGQYFQGRLGDEIRYQISTGSDASNYVCLRLPAGLSMSASGLVTGRAVEEGLTADITVVSRRYGILQTNMIPFQVANSLPVLASPTNVTAALNQPFRYQIVAGGFGREWAGYDSFEGSASTNWRAGTSLGSSLVRTNGNLMLTFSGTGTNATNRFSFLEWARNLPGSSREWVAYGTAILPTNLVTASNRYGEALIQAVRNDGTLNFIASSYAGRENSAGYSGGGYLSLDKFSSPPAVGYGFESWDGNKSRMVLASGAMEFRSTNGSSRGVAVADGRMATLPSDQSWFVAAELELTNVVWTNASAIGLALVKDRLGQGWFEMTDSNGFPFTTFSLRNSTTQTNGARSLVLAGTATPTTNRSVLRLELSLDAGSGNLISAFYAGTNRTPLAASTNSLADLVGEVDPMNGDRLRLAMYGSTTRTQGNPAGTMRVRSLAVQMDSSLGNEQGLSPIFLRSQGSERTTIPAPTELQAGRMEYGAINLASDFSDQGQSFSWGLPRTNALRIRLGGDTLLGETNGRGVTAIGWQDFGVVPRYEVLFAVSNLPAGLSLDQEAVPGLIYGTPTVRGTNLVNVIMTTSGGSRTNTVRVVVP